MKQCIQCDREYPDSKKFCELDGAYLIDIEDLGEERPEGLCPACDGLSPGIAMDGETIVHCDICHDTGQVTPEDEARYEARCKVIREKRERANAK